jgi:endonuclease/exonuclease/phosphatase (EEP) superfamily protein YafD
MNWRGFDHEESQAAFQGSIIFGQFGWLNSSPWSETPERLALTRIRRTFYRPASFPGRTRYVPVFKEREESVWEHDL